MANAVFYALLDGKRPSLKAMLGTMPAKVPEESENKELP